MRLTASHGAYIVLVFGSAARGEARPDSDVDLLVEVGPGRTPFFPCALVTEVGDLLGHDVDILTEAGLRWCIRDRVLEEAVPL